MPADHSNRFLSTPNPMAALLLAAAAWMAALAPAPVQATTLVRCKVDGKTVFSDTDCPRSTRLKNDLPASKPIKISRKTKTTSHR